MKNRKDLRKRFGKNRAAFSFSEEKLSRMYLKAASQEGTANIASSSIVSSPGKLLTMMMKKTARVLLSQTDRTNAKRKARNANLV